MENLKDQLRYYSELLIQTGIETEDSFVLGTDAVYVGS